MKRSMMAIVTVAVALAACSENRGDANSTDTTSVMSDTSSGALPRSDVAFAATALRNGRFEIEKARLAEQQATDASLKAASSMIIKDHMLLSEKIKSYAEEHNMLSSDSLDAEHLKELEYLQKKTGVNFDKSYLKDMLKAHRSYISDFKKYSEGAADSVLKKIAMEAIPVMKGHYEVLRKINKEVKASVDPGAITDGMEVMPLK